VKRLSLSDAGLSDAVDARVRAAALQLHEAVWGSVDRPLSAAHIPAVASKVPRSTEREKEAIADGTPQRKRRAASPVSVGEPEPAPPPPPPPPLIPLPAQYQDIMRQGPPTRSLSPAPPQPSLRIKLAVRPIAGSC
jgi:hypothetical protein